MTLPLIDLARLLTDSLRVDALETDWRARLAAFGPADWALLLHHADGHTLTPLLYATWLKANALDTLPPEFRKRLKQAYVDNAVRNLNIRNELLEVHDILNNAQVPHIALKGWLLVERLYADPAHRYMSDQDFLVPPEHAEAGHRALKAAGYHPLPVKDEWIEKHLPSLWRNNGYIWNGYLYDPHYPRPVELHVRLWEEGWRGLQLTNLPGLWASLRTRPLAGTPMAMLSDEHTALHLAMHFAGHLIEREARLNQLLDLARFVRDTPGLNWEQVAREAQAVGIGRFVYAALYLAHEIFGAPLPPASAWQTLRAQTPPAFLHWLTHHGVADALTSDYRRRAKGKDYQLTLMAAQSGREVWGIARFAAFPPLEQLRAKYQQRAAWLTPWLYARHVVERVKSYGFDSHR